uniref:Metal-response element-binding transcription factor 2 n=1 Tax=Aceria tosichella TaxID=561515 RepID=A0A6G1SGA8_9ACAR
MPSSIKHLKQLFSKDKAAIALLAKWPADNLYYVVNLLKLDEKKEKCFVKYEDGTDCWVSRQDVHLQFNGSMYPYKESDDIFCCLCEKDASVEPNEIILCDICQQGYHQNCHEPKIRQVEIENSTQEWCCQTCSYIMRQLDPMPNTSTPKAKPRSKKQPSPRRAAIKTAQATKPSRIKLSRDKTDKKPSQQELEQERVETNPVAPVASKGDSSAESVPGDSTDESPDLPLQELPVKGALPKDAIIDGGDNKIIATAQALVDSIGTNDFVSAIEQKNEQKAEPKAKAPSGKTNGKIPKKVVAKKTKAKAPVPA